MKKVNNKKGFTLAELLVVIAILVILVAIAIPTFGGALDKAKQTADDANIRSAYAQYTISEMTEPGFNGNVPVATGAKAAAAFTAINVPELQYYNGVSIPTTGAAWTGTGGPGGHAIAADIFN